MMLHRMEFARPRRTCTALALLAFMAGASAQDPARPSAGTAAAAADDEANAADADPPKRRPARAGDAAFKWGVDPLHIEVLHWDKARAADLGSTVRIRPYASGRVARTWEWRLGAHLEHDGQSGGARSVHQERVALGDSYLRLRHEDLRLTVGAQTIVWGRVDAVPLIDRVSRVDLRRFGLDDLADRRLPQWAVRLEQALGDWRVDAVWLPDFRPARLPHEASPWHPVDRDRAQIVGVPAAGPALAPFFQTARLGAVDEGSGGVAVRVTRTGEPVDFGLTLAHTRQPLPYMRLDLAAGRIDAVHPYNRFAAVDAEMATDDATWRTELAWTGDVPITGIDGRTREEGVVEWVGGVEFFPGGRSNRITLQAQARSVRTRAPILELREYYALNGEAETSFDRGRWKLGMRFVAGLNVSDRYLAPKISFVGWEPHEIYLTAHFFSGPSRSVVGFHRDHDAVAIGLKTRF
jgi:hypothetical protein